MYIDDDDDADKPIEKANLALENEMTKSKGSRNFQSVGSKGFHIKKLDHGI